jgi:cell division protein ZapA
MSEKAQTTTVRILGHEYRIRSAESSEFVREVALYVDELMHQISSKLTSGTPSQIAVLAALNIAEELFRERRNGGPNEPTEVSERMRAVIARLGEAVEPARLTKAAKG